MFTETASSSEDPVLSVTNTTGGPDHLILISHGKKRIVELASGETRTVQIAAGVYEVQLRSLNHLYSDWEGMAVFRSYRNYSTSYTTHTSVPLHFGE